MASAQTHTSTSRSGEAAFATLETLSADEARLLAQVGGVIPEDLACEDTRIRVFDLHCDTLDRLVLVHDPDAPGGFAEQFAGGNLNRMRSLADNDAHISLARMSAYAWCQSFSIFVPDGLDPQASWQFYQRIYDYFADQMRACDTSVAQVRTPADIDACFAARKAAALLTIEGAPFLSPEVDAEACLDTLAEQGVSMVTLTWNGENALGSGHDTRHGLSAFGRSMVRELEVRAIAVDVSHLNDEGFKDICRVATKPFAASHSNVRAVCGHPRNLADWQLRELADRGGIAGLNFCCDFLSDTHTQPTHSDVLRHVDHVLEVAGEDVCALGSDYDGCDVPAWLDPCDKIGDLFALFTDEFGEVIARKIFFDNAYNFFARVQA